MSGRSRGRGPRPGSPGGDRGQQMRQVTAGGMVRGREVDLGDLSGEVADPIQATFVWFGHRFRVNPDLTETVVVDLFEAAQQIKVTDTRQFEAAKDYVREHIHPDDFDELWRLAKRKRQGMHELMTLCWGILEGIAERPTTPPSGSSGGRPVTRQNSPDGASGRDVGAPRTADVPDGVPDWWPDSVPYNPSAAKFVDRFESEGRPDKADILMLAQEARAGL